ncbi:hypothetical protein DFH09DRAFT_976430 [Mycena vulgaris]|nr:hypothetical protein DFH09DRAFT_976430 [Mycena vulgaris]
MKRGFLNSSKAKARPLGPVEAVAPPLTDLGYFPIGKRQVTVPEGVKSTVQYKESDPRGGSDPNAMTFTTLPIGGEPEEPTTECFFFPGTKEVVMSCPGFPQPLIHPASPPFRMDPTPGKGVGLFSTRRLKAGDHILTERPLLVAARGVGVAYPAHFTREQYFQHALNELEAHFEVAFNRMDPAAKAAFMELTNSHKEDGSGPIVGRVRTNALALDGLRPGVTGDIASYSAVCKDISRLNHSCSPNTALLFDMPSFSYQLFAVRDVAKGEEFTYQYTPVDCSAAERNKALKSYDFVCVCTACTDAPASDARRLALRKFYPDIAKWALDPALADDWLIAQCLEHLALIADEGLEMIPLHLDIVTALMEVHICLGDAQGASEWAAKVESFMWDEKRADLNVKALLDPASAAYKAHPMWRLRVDGGRMPPGEKFLKGLGAFSGKGAGTMMSSGKDLIEELKALALKKGGAAGPWGMVIPMS